MARNPAPWTENDFIRAADHPLQRWAFQHVTSMLTAMREARNAAQLWAMQVELFESVLYVQRYKSEAKRNLERSKKGKPVDQAAPSGSWELEHRIASRVERQVRSVGDCLAWKVFACRRDVFFVLSQNENPGSMFGKEGLKAEIDVATKHWEQNGHFVLMNDLTLSVRIGDLIVFPPSGPALSEVKASGRRDPAQRRRIERALQALRRERPLELAGEAHEIFRAQTQLRTRMEALAVALDEAHASGFGTAVIKPGWLVIATSLRPVAFLDDSAVAIRLDESKRRASIEPGRHVLETVWSWRAWDERNPLVAGVPFGAFPLDPVRCAELTCGYASYQVFLSQALLDRELQRVGFATQWALPAGTLAPDVPIVEVIRNVRGGRRGMTVSSSAMHHCLYELMEPRRYAEAVREMFDWAAARFARQQVPAGQQRLSVGRGVMAFGNERAIWFKRPRPSGSSGPASYVRPA
jgi:hypothetical protein